MRRVLTSCATRRVSDDDGNGMLTLEEFTQLITSVRVVVVPPSLRQRPRPACSPCSRLHGHRPWSHRAAGGPPPLHRRHRHVLRRVGAWGRAATGSAPGHACTTGRRCCQHSRAVQAGCLHLPLHFCAVPTQTPAAFLAAAKKHKIGGMGDEYDLVRGAWGCTNHAWCCCDVA